MKHYDALMIGFGKGAKTLAGALAAAGQTVAVAEESENMYGGTCINVGCIPSKSLVTSAKRSLRAGGGFPERAERYAGAIREKRRVTSMLDTAQGIETVEADRVFINTGSHPFLPPIPGLRACLGS